VANAYLADRSSKEDRTKFLATWVPSGEGTQTISGSNQIESEPRCFSAVLYEGQFLVLYFVGDQLLMPISYHTGFTQ
jgi:hypothetical protein